MLDLVAWPGKYLWAALVQNSWEWQHLRWSYLVVLEWRAEKAAEHGWCINKWRVTCHSFVPCISFLSHGDNVLMSTKNHRLNLFLEMLINTYTIALVVGSAAFKTKKTRTLPWDTVYRPPSDITYRICLMLQIKVLVILSVVLENTVASHHAWRVR